MEAVDCNFMRLDDVVKWNPRLASDGTNCAGWTLYLS